MAEDENSEAQQPSVDEAQQTPRTQLRRRVFPKVGPGNEPAAAIGPDDARNSEDEQTVLMIFSKPVTLTDDEHKRIKFPVGVVAVPMHLADHWYLQAHGARRAGAAQKPVEG